MELLRYNNFVWALFVDCMSNAATKTIHRCLRRRRRRRRRRYRHQYINNGKSSKNTMVNIYSCFLFQFFPLIFLFSCAPARPFPSAYIRRRNTPRTHSQRPNIIYLSIFPLFKHTLDLLASIMRSPGVLVCTWIRVCAHLSLSTASAKETHSIVVCARVCTDGERKGDLICRWHQPTSRFKNYARFCFHCRHAAALWYW